MGFTGDGLDICGIGHFLLNRFLKVPTNQRSYAWEHDNVEDYWNDILNAISEQDEDYFIGSIVLSSTDAETLEVVDGQQRLATATIILGAIRDYFLEKDNAERAQFIENKYLLAQNLHFLRKPKITLPCAAVR